MKKIIIASLLVLSSASLYAASAKTGIAVGALGGWSFANSPSGQQVGSPKKNKNWTWGAVVGFNYAANKNMLPGFEVGYIDFGKINYGANANANIKSSGIQLLATATFLMQNGMNAFGKLGAINEETKVNNAGGSNPHKKWIPAAVIGAGYMPMQNLNLALQYERTFGSSWNQLNPAGAKPMTQNAVTLELSYNFSRR